MESHKYTDEDVALLVRYLMALWPGYQNWGPYLDAKAHSAWSDTFRRNGIRYEDTILGVQWLVDGVQRERQWPPSLSEIVGASRPEAEKRRAAWETEARERQRVERERERILRLRQKVADEGDVIREQDPERWERMLAGLVELEERHPDV